MKKVLLTHVNHFTGPGTLPVLLREKMHAVCHDNSFTDETTVLAFEQANPGCTALRAQTPEELYGELKERKLEPDAVILNDIYPNTPSLIENISLQTLRVSFEALLVFPFRLSQLFLPAMKMKKRGGVVCYLRSLSPT